MHYNPTEDEEGESTVTITYINRGSAYSADTKSGREGQQISFSAAAAPSQWAEHTFLGWAKKEFPTYAETQQAGFLVQPQASFNSSSDTTFYAVYSTTFQGLIDEGYVTLDIEHDINYGLGIGNGMFVKPNGYPKELVTDFVDVFNSAEGKLVSTGGTVGAGDQKNLFIFKNRNEEHWLTADEWYDIYNGNLLNHSVASWQFYGIDWSDKESIDIKYDAGTWAVGQSTVGPDCPRVVNIYMNNGTFGYMLKTYGETGYGCGAEIINFTNASGTKISLRRPYQGLNAAFEGCRNLKEIHGIDFSPITAWLFAFDGCRALEAIPSSDFGTELTMTGSLRQTFCNNWMLESIEPVLHVSGVTDATSTFYACSSLTELRLEGINAETNASGGGGSFPHNTAITWDLGSTVISQECVDYIVANAREWEVPEDFEYKVINFPESTVLSDEQKIRLGNCGWKAWINGEPQDVAK